MKVYPLFVVGLDRRVAVVVGGDAEAERKVLGLLACDARVTVVAPRLTPRLRRRVRHGRIVWHDRSFRSGDLHGAFLVIVTERDEATRSLAAREAAAEGALVNVVDDPARCSFIAGSIVRRGALAIAISTGGAAPALAVRLRQRLEREIGSEYGLLLSCLAALRPRLLGLDFETRRTLAYRLVDSSALDDLRAGRRAAARRQVRSLVREATNQRSR